MDLKTIIDECWGILDDLSTLERESKAISVDASAELRCAGRRIDEAINCLEAERED